MSARRSPFFTFWSTETLGRWWSAVKPLVRTKLTSEYSVSFPFSAELWMSFLRNSLIELHLHFGNADENEAGINQ